MGKQTQTGKTFTRTLLWFFGMLIFMSITLVIAGVGMEHPAETLAFKNWMYATRFGWLIWRIVLYIALGVGFWKIYTAAGTKKEHLPILQRMAIMTGVFIVLCEYAQFSTPGASS